MTASRLRIVVTADPEIPVPPSHYGGIERIVHLLVVGLESRGHKVYLFAHPDSQAPATLIPYPGRSSRSAVDTAMNALYVKKILGKLGRVDIVHSFSRLAYLFFLMGVKIPKIQSYQRSVTPRSIRWGNFLADGSLAYTACSAYCAGTADAARASWSIIPNGVPLEQYRFRGEVPSDAPLVFLGRLERIKGAHAAIDVAERTGRRLKIAGNHAPSGEGHRYFSKEILPRCDGDRIEYLGPVEDVQKNDLLGNASALLFPVEWEEPFGIVMAEALACGTPVIGFGRGAVPEVIEDKITGFLCRTPEDMVRAVSGLSAIDRKNCRRAAEKRFSDSVVVDQYEKLYYSCLKNQPSVS